MAQARLVAPTLFEQPGIGVRGAGVGVVTAFLAFEVLLGVAPGRRVAVRVRPGQWCGRGSGAHAARRYVHPGRTQCGTGLTIWMQ